MTTSSATPAPSGGNTGTPVVVQTRRGASLWLTLNRPEVMNSLDPAIVAGLTDGFAEARADAQIRCVVITGAGRAFCAGADLDRVRDSAEDTGRNGVLAFLEDVGVLFGRIESFPKPVICAVNGLALAGGLELLLCCDLVVAAKSAKIGDAHANFGLLPGGGASVRLPRKVGPTTAKLLMFTGAFLPAADLATSGLLNAVVDDEQLDSTVMGLVESIVAKSPLGLARTKQLVNDALEQPSPTALRAELVASDLHQHSEDMLEGLRAFAEKRPPRFVGR